MRVIRRDDESVVLLLLGELDVTSMVQFERMITVVLSGRPKELIFDLSQSLFISAQGYAAIGDCSLEVPVRLRSRTDLASKVLAIYGYNRVTVVIERGPDVDPAALTGRETSRQVGSIRALTKAPSVPLAQLIQGEAS